MKQEKQMPGIDEEQLLKPVLTHIKHKLMILSGKGGVGKSTIAACLAIALAKKGNKVGLLDIDLHGPSIPHLLNIPDILNISPEQKVLPKEIMPNLEVVSMECLMADKDQAVIWRGPLKHTAIRQFISDVQWGDLDYLVVDSPPGTGDEPLSIAQLIPEAKAIIVATPQEVALADVRKSITFCREVDMDIAGIIENMSGFICPHCGKEVNIFKTGGAERTALAFHVEFLGKLPFDLGVVEAGDAGKLIKYMENQDNFYNKVFFQIADRLIQRLEQMEVKPVSLTEIRAKNSYKITIPLKEEKPAPSLTTCDKIAMVHVKDGQIKKVERITPSEQGPIRPKVFVNLGADLVMTKDMKEKAKYVFYKNKVGVVLDIPDASPKELVQKFIKGELGGK
ncbi:MAG: P-loop NTPase [Candidatus Desulfofervidus sp.]|nr:P-loop NTPase [Candidatus Desulfofervidus sp.]